MVLDVIGHCSGKGSLNIWKNESDIFKSSENLAQFVPGLISVWERKGSHYFEISNCSFLNKVKFLVLSAKFVEMWEGGRFKFWYREEKHKEIICTLFSYHYFIIFVSSSFCRFISLSLSWSSLIFLRWGYFLGNPPLVSWFSDLTKLDGEI